MSIDELYQKVKHYPTIMNIEDEIYMVEQMQKFSIEEIKTHRELFHRILDDLDTSRTGGSIFEITNENLPIFEKFCNWLQEIALSLNERKWLIYAENLSCKFE